MRDAKKSLNLSDREKLQVVTEFQKRILNLTWRLWPRKERSFKSKPARKVGGQFGRVC